MKQLSKSHIGGLPVLHLNNQSIIKAAHELIWQHRAYAPQPNWGFNADANISHAFGIFMAYVGALQPSASGAG